MTNPPTNLDVEETDPVSAEHSAREADSPAAELVVPGEIAEAVSEFVVDADTQVEADRDLTFDEPWDAQAPWNYPLDSVSVRTETRTVYDILRRIDKGSFVMDPDFQRDYLWDVGRQSRLIESVLMRIPLPVFYLAENAEGRMIVVDGLQRLSTLQRFFRDELRLQLPGQDELHNQCFSEVSAKLQNRIEDCNLTLYIIDEKVPERLRLDIFERVNGGVPITRQQMRNCIYTGPATQFLRDQAASPLFAQVLGHRLQVEPLLDRQFINRFCGFQLLPLESYSDMDDFLARALGKMNQLPTDELEALGEQFRLSLENSQHVFGPREFCRNGHLSAPLWDVLATGLSRYSAEQVKAKTTELRDAVDRLLGNAEFLDAIGIASDDVHHVRYRFSAMSQCLQEVFGC